MSDYSYIPSFTGKAYMWSLDNAWLNPQKQNPYKLNDLGSLTATFANYTKGLDQLFQSRRKIPKPMGIIVGAPHFLLTKEFYITLGKSYLKLGLSFAILVVLSPVGTLYNGSACLLYASKIGLRQIKVLNQQNLRTDWQKLYFYAQGFFKDGLVFLYTHVPAGTYFKFFHHIPNEWIQELLIFPAFLPVGLSACVMSLSTINGLKLVVPQPLRFGLMAAFTLRKRYGLVGPKGNRLISDKQDGENDRFEGMLQKRYDDAANEIAGIMNQYGITIEHQWEKATSLRGRLFFGDVFSSILLKKAQDFSFPAGLLLRRIHVLVDRMVTSSKVLVRGRKSYATDLNSWNIFIDKDAKFEGLDVPESIKTRGGCPNSWKEAFAKWEELRKHARECNDEVKVSKQEEEILKNYKEVVCWGLNLHEWDTLVEKTIRGAKIKDGEPNIQSPIDREWYIAFRQNIFNRVSAEELFGFEDGVKPSTEKINAFFRKGALILHDDKFPKPVPEEVKELFHLLTAAKEYLLKLYP